MKRADRDARIFLFNSNFLADDGGEPGPEPDPDLENVWQWGDLVYMAWNDGVLIGYEV